MPCLSHLKSLYVQFGKATNLVPIYSTRNSRFIFSLCSTINAMQLLTLVIHPYSGSSPIVSLPEGIFPYLFSIRAWIQFTGVQITTMFGVFLAISFFFAITIIAALVHNTRKKALPKYYEMIIKYQILYFFQNLWFIPSIEIGLILVSRSQTYLLPICSGHGACNYGLLSGGVIMIVLACLVHLFFESITIQNDFQNNRIALRYAPWRTSLRMFYSIVLGGVAIGLNTTENYLICSLVWAAVTLLETLLGTFYFEFIQNSANRTFSFINIISIHIVAHQAIIHWEGDVLAIISRIFSAFLLKFVLNLQQKNLWRLWRSLSSPKSHDKTVVLENLDRSLKILYHEFTSHKESDYMFVELLVPIIAHQKSVVDQNDSSKKALFKDSDIVHPFAVARTGIMETIEDQYHSTILNGGKRIPIWFHISYVNFLTTVSSKHIQAMFIITNIRKDYQGQISRTDSLNLDLQEEIIQRALHENNENIKLLNVSYICKYLKQFEDCKAQIDELIQEKAGLFGKFMESVINMKSVKNESKRLFRKAIDYTTKLERLMRIDEIHIETHLLYQFFVKDLQEDLNRYNKTKSTLAEKKLRELIRGQETLKKVAFSNEVLLNSDLNQKFMFAVASLQPNELGKVIAASNNCKNILDLSDRSHTGRLINQFFTPFQAKSVESFLKKIQNVTEAETQNERITFLYLAGKGGDLLKCKPRMELTVFEGKLSMTFYFRIDESIQNEIFLVVDSRGKIVHLPEGAFNLLFQEEPAERFYEIVSSERYINEVLPDFEIPDTRSIEIQRKTSKVIFPKFSSTRTYQQQNKDRYLNFRVQRIQDELSKSYYWKLLFAKNVKGISTIIPTQLLQSEASLKNIRQEEPASNMTGAREITIEKDKTLLTETLGNSMFTPKGVDHMSLQSGNEPRESGKNIQWASGNSWFKDDASFNQKFFASANGSVIPRSSSRQFTKIDPLYINPKQRDVDVEEMDDVKDEDFYPPPKSEKELEVLSSNKGIDFRGEEDFSKRRRHTNVQASIYASESESSSNSKSARFLIGVYHLKEMINQEKSSGFLIQINVFGSLVLGIAGLLILVYYFVLKSQLDQYTQYSNTAYFPAYFASVMKSVAPETEIAVLVNSGVITNATIKAALSLTPPSVYKNRIQRFIMYYDEYFVQYNIQRVLPNVDSDRYALYFKRSIFDQNASRYDFQESTTVFLGLIYTLNKTKFSQITNTNLDVQFLRNVSWAYIDMYQLMRADLFSYFYAQQALVKNTLQSFEITLGVYGAIAFLTFIYFARRIQSHESRFLSKLCTIKDEHVIGYLGRLQTLYSSFYGKPLRISTVGQNIKKKGEKNGSNTISKKFSNQSNTSLTYIVFFSLIPCVVIAFGIACSFIFQAKVDSTNVFIEDLDIMSEAVPYIGQIRGTTLLQMNTLTYNPDYAIRYQDYGEIDSSIISFLQNSQSRILTNPNANNTIKQLYANLTSINFCYDNYGTAYYVDCLTCFDGASQLGFASFFSATYNFQMLLINSFAAEPTKQTVSTLLDTSQFEQLNNNGPTADAIFVFNIQTEGQFLYNFCSNIEYQLIYVLISGLIMTLLLGVLIWRPIFSRMEIQFLHIRQIFSQLPAEIIVQNNYIKNLLKNEQGSI